LGVKTYILTDENIREWLYLDFEKGIKGIPPKNIIIAMKK